MRMPTDENKTIIFSRKDWGWIGSVFLAVALVLVLVHVRFHAEVSGFGGWVFLRLLFILIIWGSGLLLVLPKRGLQIAYAIVLGMWVLLLDGVSLYHEVFGFLPTLSTTSLAGNLTQLGPSILHEMSWVDWGLITMLGVACTLVVLMPGRTISKKVIWCAIAGLVLPCLPALIMLSWASRDRGSFNDGVWYFIDYMFTIEAQSALQKYGFTGHMWFELRRASGTNAELVPLANPLPRRRKISWKQDRTLNILVLQVESLESSVIDYHNNGQPVTPFLNKLKQGAFYFPNIFACHGMGGSSDAEIAALTSLYPLSNGPVMVSANLHNVPSLARILGERNYECYGFHGNTGSFWNRLEAYGNLGFDRLFEQQDYTGLAKGWTSRDHEFLQQSIDLLQKSRTADKPFFAYMITQTMHEPFTAVGKDSSFEPDPRSSEVVGNYLRSAHYTDNAIKDFIQRLVKDGIMKNTVVIILGDHATRLRDDTYQSKAHPGENIPLFIVCPWRRGTTIPTYGSQVDIAPTILDILGIEPPQDFVGRSLFRWMPTRLLPIDVGMQSAIIGPQKRIDVATSVDLRYQQLLQYCRSHFMAVPRQSFSNPPLRTNSYVAHALGRIGSRTYTNSKEAFEWNYSQGARLFEVDFAFTKDSKVVCVHEGTERDLGLRPITTMTHSEFMSSKNRNKYTPLDLEAILRILENHPDIYLITDVKRAFEPFINVLANEVKSRPDLASRIFPQVYSGKDIRTVDAHGVFPKMILTLYQTDASDAQVLRWIAGDPGIAAVTVSEQRFSPKLLESLQEKKIPLFVHTINDLGLVEQYRGFGVQGVYSDLPFRDFPLRAMSAQ